MEVSCCSDLRCAIPLACLPITTSDHLSAGRWSLCPPAESSQGGSAFLWIQLVIQLLTYLRIPLISLGIIDVRLYIFSLDFLISHLHIESSNKRQSYQPAQAEENMNHNWKRCSKCGRRLLTSEQTSSENSPNGRWCQNCIDDFLNELESGEHISPDIQSEDDSRLSER